MSHNVFDERESGFEAKYKLDQETQFKARARRNKKLGLWAADLLGMSGDQAGAYACQVLETSFEHAGDSDMVTLLLRDFAKREVRVSEAQILRKLDYFYAVAMNELGHEYPMPLGDDHHL